MRNVPMIAVLLGSAGLIPFVACSLGATTLTGSWATLSLQALLGYAAVILSFTGAVHWGIGLEQGDNQTIAARRSRFGLGVVPALLGWAGMLVAGLGLATAGLLILIVGYAAAISVETKASKSGLLPPGYLVLRWIWSIVALVCLIATALVLMMGGRVIL